MSRHNPIHARASALPDTDLNPNRDAPLDFPDREFGELRPADYAAMGFLCGLEVHQQLATAHKLFCRCPSGRRSTQVDAEVLRHMRPTLSEMGEYDGTALMEFKTRKEIVYLLERGSVCTYEMDDTPPFPVNQEAVRAALRISRMFGLDLVSELHVMRKQYLDGSIPTGFQRTAMVGLGGAIPFRESELGADRELRIRQLSLEEDSCREVEDIGHRIVFRTDRLGTPLIETVTEPDLLTPADVAAAGRLMAQIARTSGIVSRGAGAARQDVNVSIAGSRRVEIKGVDHHRGLPLLVHNEAYRHLNLLRIRAELQRRGVRPDMFELPAVDLPWESEGLVVDARPMLGDASPPPIYTALGRGDMVCAVRLRGFAGLLRHPSQPGVPFVHEIAERVRVIACPTARPFLTCSDREHGIGESTWRALREACRAESGDALVLLWAPERDAATAAREVLARAAEALIGVPSETRQARPDGTTGFERILPGPQRMYPDTDTPPLPISDAWMAEAEADLPEPPWKRADRYAALGISAGAAARLAAAPWAELFDRLAPEHPETARRLAAALEKRLVHYWRESGARELPQPERLSPLINAMDHGLIAPAAFEPCLDRLLRDRERAAVDIVGEHSPAPDADATLEELTRQARAARPGLDGAAPAAVLRWAMGTVLAGKPRGTLDPRAARESLIRALELTEVEA